jgi:hypothetical protein
MADMALVQVTAHFYQKGDEIGNDPEHQLWLNSSWEDTTDANSRPNPNDKPKKDQSLASMMDIAQPWGELVFLEDNVGFDFDYIGGNPEPGYSCSLDCELSHVGVEEVFSEFLEDFARIGQLLRKPFPIPEKTKGIRLNEKYHRQVDNTSSRFIAIISFSYWQSYEGEWDMDQSLDGVLDINNDPRLKDCGLPLFKLNRLGVLKSAPEADAKETADAEETK